MDYSKLFEDSFAYVKEAIWGKWIKWFLLIVFLVIFPLFLGYVAEIFRGKKPAPELENWTKMFIDGLKILVILIIYSLPIILVTVFFLGSFILAFLILNPALIISSLAVWSIILVILFLIIAIFASVAIVRFARTEKMGEAFNFNAIKQHISSIGWLNYILALIILYVAIFIIQYLVSQIPVLGDLINIILGPAYGIFAARYLTLVYDSAKVSQ